MQVVATAGPASGSVQLRIRGELDIATAPELAAELERVLAAHPRLVVLELGELSFLDCAGMRPLRHALSDLRCRGGSLVIRHAPPLAERALHLAGLGDALDRGGVPLG
jgi:anti-anti-sigma factor